MAYEELFKKIKDYESKWGKLGAGNSILNPEKTTISHSGLNSSNNFYGGKRKMLNMTNDYYEFRRKVAEGKKNNKLAHAATVDIDEINRQHWERINSDGTLIHASNKNYKYYNKIDLGNGNTRYFYTKEEWDAYQNEKKGKSNAKPNDYNVTLKLKNPDGDALGIKGTGKTLVKTAQNIQKAEEKLQKENAKKIFNNLMKGHPAYKKVNEEWDALNDPDDTPAGEEYKDLKYDVDSHIREIMKDEDDIIADVLKEYGCENGDDYLDQMEDRIESKWGHNPSGEDLQNALNDLKDEMTVVTEINNKIEKAFKEEAEKIKKADKIYNEACNAMEAYEDLYKNELKNLSKSDTYLMLEELGLEDFADDYALFRYFGYDFHKGKDVTEYMKNSDDYGAEMLNTMKTGLKKLMKDCKSLMKEMSHSFDEDDDYLEHADRNVKYYQKIELPNGKTRYFYTREEWDAYQNGQKQSEAESKRNPNGTMKDTAKRALEIPMRTTKDIIKSNQAAKRMAEKNNEYTNDEGERYSTYESRQTKKEITGPNATKSKRIKHSFEDNDTNESIMSEYRAFKARADRGAEMNRLTHSSFISPSELNERYEEEIASHCFLAHAGGYGAPSGTNAYVAKIDDFYGKGKPRYFYSREEYDAYQRNAKGAQNAGADRASKETATGVRQNQINNAKKAVAEREAAKNYKNNEDYAQNAGKERSEKETGMDATRQKQVADAKKAIAKREADAKAKEQSANQAGSAKQGESEGKGYAEYQKQQKEKLAQERAEISKKNDSGRDAAMKAGQKSEQERQAKEAKLDEARKTQKEAEASGNNRTQSDTSYNGEDLANALKRNTSKDKIDNLGTELGSILAEYYKVVDNNDNSDAGYKAKRKAWDNYFEKRDEIFNKYGIEFNSPEYAEAQKVVKEIEAEYEKSRELKGKNLHFKHSALDELNEFKAKVAMGKEKNRLAHSRMISLTELQHAASSKYGAPSGTNKYYAKLDDFYGKGKPRYFYTKEEWDGYQRNAKGASQAGADRAQKEKNNNDPNYLKNKAAAEAQKKVESDKWDTHKKIREDFHQVPGYMTYSSRFTDDMKATPEGSDKGKEYFSKVLNDAYEKYPSMKNIKTNVAKDVPKPKDEEVFAFMDEVQKGIDKYTKNFIGRYQLPEQEYTPLINNYFLNMTDQLMKDGKLDYDYIEDVYYRNSDVGKKEAVKEEILKQGDFNNRIFRDYTPKYLIYNEIFDKDYDRDSEVYKVNLQNFADNGPECEYLKESIEELKNRKTPDGKQQYSDEDIYNAAYTFLWKNFQKQAVDSNYAFSPNLYNLIPDIMNAMGYKGSYTADPQDLIIKIK